MGKLVAKLGAGLSYFAIATVLAIGVLIAIGFYTGKLSQQKLARLRAVIHGTDQDSGGRATLPLDAEQPSYDEILQQRAIDFRQLELREEVVRQNVSFIIRQRGEITANRQEFDRAKQAFDDELVALRNEASSTGEENVRLSFENIKPVQAKQQIMLMLDRGEIEKVVSLFAAMSINKRAKIFAEFKSPDDATRLSKILELMGDGAPLAGLVEQPPSPTETEPANR